MRERRGHAYIYKFEGYPLNPLPVGRLKLGSKERSHKVLIKYFIVGSDKGSD